MPYREKIAWLSLVAIVVAFGPYFSIVALSPPPDDVLPNLGQLGLLGTATLLQVLILGIGHFSLRRLSPQDALLPLDERDRAIEHRSFRFAYYVLIGGMIVVGCVMPFDSTGWSIVNSAVLMIIAAELVHFGFVAYSYRRQV